MPIASDQTDRRRRAVICVPDPWRVIPQLPDWSIMVINPQTSPDRMRYLLAAADWSLLIDDQGEHYREGGVFANERVFWYTSGTTGDSRFCSFSGAQIADLARRITAAYDITANDRYVSIMPLWHAHGQGFYWATQAAGCETHFLSATQVRDLGRQAPTFVTAIPDLLRLILDLPLQDLRFIRSASSALSHALYHQLEDRFRVPVIEAFGMTEALSHCFTNPLHGLRKIGTVGRPDGVEARIQDHHLMIRGPTVHAPDWYDTGDLAHMDQDGYYTILGRSRDQINVRGIKLNPVSLEQQIMAAVPGVRSVVCFGHDRVRCLYVGEVAADRVKAYLASMGRYCIPEFVLQVDSIPNSPSGKLSRSWLCNNYSKA